MNDVEGQLGMIDAHCHLEEEKDAAKREELISSCKSAGMSALVTVCAKPADLEFALEISKKHAGFVFATAGLHPLEAASLSQKDIDLYTDQIRAHKSDIKAIGEIGLDHILVTEYRKKDFCREVFSQFIELAAELDLPIIIHCREAYPEVIRTLAKRRAEKVVFHYFNQPKHVSEIQENGWHVSLPAVLALSGNRVAEILKLADLDLIMVETDSPIQLSGGRKITPLDVKLIVEAIAKERKETLENIIEETASSAIDFYSLPI